MTREPAILKARAEFHDRFSDLARGKRSWQLAAFGLLALLAAVTGAYIRLASTSRITPYVVEVDRLGRAAAFGPAEQLKSTDQRVVVAQLALFIRDLRSVYADPGAQKELIYRAYAYVADSARGFLDRTFADPRHDPRVLAQRLTRQVEVGSVLQVPGSDTWKLQWTETETPRRVGQTRTSAWEAYLTVKVRPPETAETILDNPLGLYITALNWTQIQTPQGDTP